MLKCNINKAKGKVRINGKGTPHILMVETGALIADVYHQTHKKSPEAAREYKMKLIGVLLDPKSPVWEED